MSKEKLEFVEPVNTNTDNEYSREPVPLGSRKSCFSLTIVWTGFVFLVTSMMAGGGLAAGLTFNELLLAMVLGNIFLCIIAGLVSVIAYKTGLTFALLTRYSFGQEGSRIASLFVPIVNL
ncbi:MAG: cytosine permease, partial [Veillonella sp.]|nr:cytosine permease [Veillonella sp.]